MLASQCQRAWSNFYEVGGKDVATLGSVANTIANGANLIIPFVGVTLRGACCLVLEMVNGCNQAPFAELYVACSRCA